MDGLININRTAGLRYEGTFYAIPNKPGPELPQRGRFAVRTIDLRSNRCRQGGIGGRPAETAELVLEVLFRLR
jgi:hypothetical protein